MFSIDWRILVAQLINFYVLLWILRTYLFTPAVAVIDERRARIAADVDQAARDREEARAMREDYEQRLARVEEEAYQLRQRAIAEARRLSDTIVTEARQREARLIQNAQSVIARDQKKAWLELRSQVVDLTIRATERVIQRTLDDQAHHDLIERTIVELERPS